MTVSWIKAARPLALVVTVSIGAAACSTADPAVSTVTSTAKDHTRFAAVTTASKTRLSVPAPAPVSVPAPAPAPVFAPAQGPTKVNACPRADSLSAAHDAQVKPAELNQALLDSAVLHFTNLRRCANGLAPLSADAELRRVAADHSADMARLDFFSHNSPVPGKRKFVDRLKNAGIAFRGAAENLGRFARLQMVSAQPFYVIDEASCNFSYRIGGEPIVAHTYRTLAKTLVEGWEKSPGHRANLFNATYRRVGTGGALRANPENCGDVYATQNFAL